MVWWQDLEQGTPAFNIAASESPSVRVVAGPGSGKSFAMKRRVARLLEIGIAPSRILPVTFTRVAAEDLHRELVGMGVAGCDQLRGTTLHSLALRVLMRNHVLEATGRTPRPLNEFEMRPLEFDLRTHGGLREVRRKIKAYESAWARLQQDEPGHAQAEDDIDFAHALIQWMLFHEAMLIGEVIPQFYEYLRLNPVARERTEFSYILVDEYQDLNRAEQAVIELLSDNAEVCIVGDDDQSIYSFKHAHPEGIREWIETHEGAEDYTLAECRRCPTRVVHMANALIAHNQMRPVPRQLVPRAENGEGDVRVIQYERLEDEINGIAAAIGDLIESGVPAGDILVLAQRGAIGTPIYDQLIARNIPVRSYYAEAELDAEDAQRRFAILKLLVDRDDRVSLRWLLGVGSTNWRAPGYRRIWNRCVDRNVSPWQTLSDLSEGNDKVEYVGHLVARFEEIRAEIVELEECGSLRGVVDRVFPEGYEPSRELRKLAVHLIDEAGIDDRAEFLSELVSAITAPEVPSEVEDVRIMSLHKSKGLSAPVTIIAGCIEGLLPMRADSSLSPQARASHLEEQRRLFFVGVTRVKAVPNDGKPGTLILTYSRRMPLATAMRAGISPAGVNFGTANLIASRFIAEMGAATPDPIAG